MSVETKLIVQVGIGVLERQARPSMTVTNMIHVDLVRSESGVGGKLSGCILINIHPWLGCVVVNKQCNHNFYNLHCIILGVRSLANASRARQFNPLNPPGVGWVTASSNKYGSRGRSYAVSHAWSVVRGRSCAVGRARSVVRAWSCGRAVLPASRPALP